MKNPPKNLFDEITAEAKNTKNNKDALKVYKRVQKELINEPWITTD